MANRRPSLTTSVRLLTTLLISTLCTAAEASAATLTTIHAFTGSPGDGANPAAGVFIGPGGVIYGTTPYGGTVSCKLNGIVHECGTVFSLAPPIDRGDPWTEDIYSFSNSTKFGPYGGVVGRDGVLYGTTLANWGLVFALRPPAAPGGQWIEKEIASGGPPVIYPYDTPAISASGVVYVTTQGGGFTFDSFGDLVSVTPPTSPGGPWTTTVLCSLGSPETGVVIGSGGILYGTTIGSVYSVTPPASPGVAWTGTTIYTFAGPPGDGANTSAGVVIGAGGVLYGTTSYGGTGSCSFFPPNPLGCGTVYSLTPPAVPGGNWTETVLYNFTGGSDGTIPNAVVLGRGGVLYGTTYAGGASKYGTVYSLTPPTSPGGAWTHTVLHSFTGGSDGANPRAGLAIGYAGELYGTTYSGGSLNNGTVFALAP